MKTPIYLLLLLFNLSVFDLHCFAQSTDNKLFKGIYVASDWKNPVEDYVLKNPDVDGVCVRLYWNDLQPEQGKYDWTALDAQLKRISDAGKNISIGVVAGSKSPAWIFNAGVPSLSFDQFRGRGEGKRFSEKIPIPWNEKYLQYFTVFLTAFANHLKSLPEAYNKITLIKLTGINETTFEIRLPAQKEIKNERGSSSNAPALWRETGYRPQLVRQAWEQILQSFADNFPGKYFSMAVIPKNGFPLIDESGNEKTFDKKYDFTEELINDGNAKLKDHFVVQWNNLRQNGNLPLIMSYVDKFNIPKGYQLDVPTFGNPDCLQAKTPCDEFILKSVIEKGIRGRASFIEIFPKDVLAFPNAIAYGHEKLTK